MSTFYDVVGIVGLLVQVLGLFLFGVLRDGSRSI